MTRRTIVGIAMVILSATTQASAQAEQLYGLMVPASATTINSGCVADSASAEPDDSWHRIGCYATEVECTEAINKATVTFETDSEVTTNDCSKTAQCVPMLWTGTLSCNVGITSFATPSTPDYEQGGGPSGFNLGDLPDDEFPDLPPLFVEHPSGSNTVVYGPIIYTEVIDAPTSTYLLDDSDGVHKCRDNDCSSLETSTPAE